MPRIQTIIRLSKEAIDKCFKNQEERRQMIEDNIKRCEAGLKAFQKELDSLQDIETDELIQLALYLPDLQSVLTQYLNIVTSPARSLRYAYLLNAIDSNDMTQMDAWLEFLADVKQDGMI